MYSIVVADDDRIIRKGLIKIIEKSGEQFQIAGEAANGAKALEMIKNSKPDILITDIKMPVMDGVQLVNEIKKENIEVKTVVLSGFDDYKYVRETLKGGAYDYILKPIDNAAMLETLNKVREDIIKARKEREQMNHFSEIVSESENIIKEKAFIKLLEGNLISAEEIDRFADLRISGAEKSAISVLSVDGLYRYEENSGMNSNILAAIKEKLYEEFNETDCTIIAAEKDNNIVLLFKGTKEYNYNFLINMLEKIQNSSCEDGISITIGIGNLFSSAEGISKAYIEAARAAEYKFYDSKNKIYFYQNNCTASDDNAASNQLEILEDSLVNSIQLCYLEKTKAISTKIFEYISKFKIQPQSVRKMLCSFITKVASQEKDFQSVLEDYSEDDVMWHIENIDVFSELRDYTVNFLIHAVQKMKAVRDERSKKIIERAKTYIKEHYNEDITLKVVADYVFLNPNYFSKLFKEEVDKNFIDYLIETRIEAAKEMLKIPGMKVYEVAQNIGYNEVVSFNRAFKKVVGVSPKEYLSLIN